MAEKRITRASQSAPQSDTRVARQSTEWSIREVQITPSLVQTHLNDDERAKANALGWSGLPSVLSRATFELGLGDKVCVEPPISPIIGTLMFYYLVCDDENMRLNSYIMRINREEHTAKMIISDERERSTSDERRKVTIVWF